MTKAYYNENDPFAAAWLRELIKANLIAPGDVDERSIKEVQFQDLEKYTQCHFFAGIGVWSYALRQAGWSDDRQVWTGSCPCQPFSAAGQKGGFDDARHLWPDWFRLIKESNPDTIFGEQVASKDGLTWFDLVSSDLERENYTVGAADTCSAGIGAPHIRQRLYFVADSKHPERGAEFQEHGNPYRRDGFRGSGLISKLADTNSIESRTRRRNDGEMFSIPEKECKSKFSPIISRRSSTNGKLADNPSIGRREECSNNGGLSSGDSKERFSAGFESGSMSCSSVEHSKSEQVGVSRCAREPRATNGFWSACDWIPCIDGKARSVEPGTFPLASGITNRVGLLRGYGNSLTAPVAQAFIEAYLEVERESRK